MTFFARIKLKSHIDVMWKDRNAVSGMLCGIRFVRTPDGVYESEGSVPDESVDALIAHNSVIVETVTMPVGQLDS